MATRTGLHDARNRGQEAHVEHPVGFVENQQVDRVQPHQAALDKVRQATRRGDNHLHAALDIGQLRPFA